MRDAELDLGDAARGGVREGGLDGLQLGGGDEVRVVEGVDAGPVGVGGLGAGGHGWVGLIGLRVGGGRRLGVDIMEARVKGLWMGLT